ncbi:ABC transporter permease [Actinophytocola sediminis]
MRELTLAAIRYRVGSFVAVFVAVLCASTLLTALGVLFESGLRSGVAPQRYVGAPVVVGGQQALPVVEDLDLPFAERVPLPADAVAMVADVPGVDRAIGETSVSLTVENVPGARGFGWSSSALTPLSVGDGAAPDSATEVVVDRTLAEQAGLSVGDSLPVAIGGLPTNYVVAGIADPPSGVDTGRQPALFFTDERARELSGRPDQVDVIGVMSTVDPEELAARITAALPELDVLTYVEDDRGDVEFLDVGAVRSQLVVLTLAFAGSALMIAMLVVAGTLGLAIQQRQRELALLRAVAATPRQIHRMLGAEILWVAGIASVLGAGPGIGVAFLLRSAFAEIGLLPADFGLALSPFPAVAAIVLMVGTARLAGWFAARRAARIDPVSALREVAVEPAGLPRWRVIAAWVCAVLWLGGSVLPLFLPGEIAVAGAASSALFGVIAILLCGPAVIAVAVRVAGPLLRSMSPVGGHLATASVATNTRRLAGVVAPLVLAITMASVQIFTQTTIAAAAAEQADSGVVADYVVTGPSGVAPAVTGVVRAADGVDAVTPVVRSQVFVPNGQEVSSFAAQGISPEGLAKTLDLDPRSGDLNRLTGDTVALSENAAETLGVDVGSTVDMRLGDGAALRAEVVATYGRGLGFGEVTLPHDLLAEHTTSRLDHSLLVSSDAPLSIGPFPGVSVVDREELAAAGEDQRATESWTNLIALFVILGYLAIAVVNTLVMATAARGREFALLRLVGTKRTQVVRMMRIEALLVVAIAVVVGTVTAVPPLIGVSIGLTESPVPSAPPLIYLAVIGTTALLGLLAVGIPTRVALRTRPVEAISERE